MNISVCPSDNVLHRFLSKKEREETHEDVAVVNPTYLQSVLDDQMLFYVDFWRCGSSSHHAASVAYIVFVVRKSECRNAMVV